MRRPIAVTASAIVAILGSILGLMLAAMAVASLFLETSAPRPPNSTPSIVMAAAMIAGASIIGLLTAVGLFRLQPWARTSILVFAGLTASAMIFAFLMVMMVPRPPDISAATQQSIRRTLGAAFGIPFAISVWWLIQFNTRSMKSAFTAAIPGRVSVRPLTISLVAWASLIGGLTSLVPIFTRAPAFLFAVQFNGWVAGVIYAVFAAVLIYIGKGLLELDEGARVVAIGWYSFSLVHLAVVTLVPPLRGRILSQQQAIINDQPNPVPFNMGMALNLGFGFTAIVTGLCIWFLIREHAAFSRTETA